MSGPRFSVVLPTVDRSTAIRATIDSVLAQEERDLELIVVSDASADDTDDVVRSYDDPRVTLVRRTTRAGHPGPVRNDGLAAARGRLVAYIDHDDRWQPDHLTRLGVLLDGGADVVAACAERLDERGAVVGRSTPLDAVWHPEIQAMAAMFEPSRVAHTRAVVTAAGGWTDERAGLEDWDLWLRLADRGARFATTTQRTALLHTATTTRTHELPLRYALTLATIESAAHAHAALAYLRLPAVRARLRELHVACAQAWYGALATTGELVLPDGVTASALPQLIEAAVPDDTTEALAIRPRRDGVAVVRPLACTSREHAARIEAILRARFAPKLRWLVRALRAAAPDSAAGAPSPRPARTSRSRARTAAPGEQGADRAARPQHPRRAAAPDLPYDDEHREAVTWRSPTSVVFGAGAVARLGPLATSAGGRALVVTDATLAGGPAVGAVSAALAAAGVEHTIFDGVHRDPSLADVEAAAAAAAGATLVVGAGGGSVMDVAKAAALAARSPELLVDPAWERTGGLVLPALAPDAAALALVQVPTSPATGAEATALAALTDGHARKRLVMHPALHARAALIDPGLQVTLDAARTAQAATEALLRLAVPYLTECGRRPLADALAEGTMRVILAAAPRALADPGDVEARGDLALASTSSQLGWSGLGRDPFGNVLFYLEHGLATAAAATKGAGMAALLPAYLRAVLADGEALPRLGAPARLAALGAAVLGTGNDAAAAADALVALVRGWGLPSSLEELGLAASDVASLTDATLELWGEERILGWLGRARIETLLTAACAQMAECELAR